MEGPRASLARLREAAQTARSRAQQAVAAVSGQALAAGQRAQEAAAEAAACLRAEDPEDVRATVVCSELAGPLNIRPGVRELEVLSAWFGHSSDPALRCDIADAVRTRVAQDHSLTLPASRRVWGDPAPGCLKVLSVTYQRRADPDGGAPTPGELLRRRLAKEAVAHAVERASYEALKEIAGSPGGGSWISATPVMMGVPVLGGSVHAIYVSPSEVISWNAETGVTSVSYLAFLREVGVAELQVLHRPRDLRSAQEIVLRARGLLSLQQAEQAKSFQDSRSFASHCCEGGAGLDALASAKSAGAMGAAVLVAAHVDEAAAAVALPFLGAGAAVAVGVVGAVIVSPLMVAGLWHMQRRNDARLGFAIVNRTGFRVSLNAFDLADGNRLQWGLVRSSCAGLGGQASGDLEAQQILELNPPSSSEIFQLRCVPAAPEEPRRGWRARLGSAQEKSINGSEDYLDGFKASEQLEGAMTCVQSVLRGRVYCVELCGGALVAREVPKHIIPAFAPS